MMSENRRQVEDNDKTFFHAFARSLMTTFGKVMMLLCSICSLKSNLLNNSFVEQPLTRKQSVIGLHNARYLHLHNANFL